MPPSQAVSEQATFAGGCFWCVAACFDGVHGVLKTVSGYAGGHVASPSYEQVCSGHTGHTEVVQVTFDPNLVSYTELLERYWRNIDPTTVDQQFCDKGSQYRTAIFWHDDHQRQLAEASRLTAQQQIAAPIVTQIVPLEQFWPAEAYHQDYHQKNPLRYQLYHQASGRKQRLQQLWSLPFRAGQPSGPPHPPTPSPTGGEGEHVVGEGRMRGAKYE
ncbi:MAG: peptide-methionine (S)-S-oxide reductase MsrA [Magnetococcales bacterium]|nr:peptide-methionine (S)-S-oxide reductase MsrA [Magnetococcales bacterium]